MDMSTIWPVIKPILAGQIRTHLAVVAGGLVTAGAIQKGDADSFAQMGSGIAIWAIIAVWSWWQKVGQAKLLAFIAKMKPVAAPNATTGEAVKAAETAQAAVTK
jgi:hypothetical protein